MRDGTQSMLLQRQMLDPSSGGYAWGMGNSQDNVLSLHLDVRLFGISGEVRLLGSSGPCRQRRSRLRSGAHYLCTIHKQVKKLDVNNMATSITFGFAPSKMNLLKLVPRHFLRAATSVNSSCSRGLSTDDQDELYRQITIEVKGHNPAVLNSYQKFTVMAADELGINIAKIFEPPRVMTRMSLMKSVFVHKKHFHQYEMRTLYRVFELKHLTGSTASTFLEYIQRNMPEGVAMKVTKHQLERFPEHLKPPSNMRDNTDETMSSPRKITDESGQDTNSVSEIIQKTNSSPSSSSSSLLSSSVDSPLESPKTQSLGS
ncbi:hypothetical protein RRG08_030553 [Elysia crispata]|uniref:Small ribosomal subunit protein uS10m n=1 Tax=Elysia crispata TaxID=231223 RepID=A0AAE0Y2G9_9GAST|nr:hypothetical protein RRG08_030553 [Elysia crispata]